MRAEAPGSDDETSILLGLSLVDLFSFTGDEVGNIPAGVDLLRRLSESLRRVWIAGPYVTPAKNAVVRDLSSGGTVVEGDALDVCPILAVVW